MAELFLILTVVLVTLSPLVEINGSIPLGIALGLEPWLTFLVAVVSNSSLFFLIYITLNLLYKNFLIRIKSFKNYIEKSREKVKPYIRKYGYLGLTAFIALPSPFTGVYTGSIIAWVLGMDWKKSFFSITIAVLINGVIVLAATLGFFEFLKFLF